MVGIRRATDDDLLGIIDMGAQFYAQTSYAGFAEYDAGSAYALAEILLQHGVLLVAEDAGELVGMVGLMVAPFPFNLEHKTAHEVMWWVNEDARAKGVGRMLLEAVEPACKQAGATAIQMVHLENSPPQAAALYERLGYGHTESSYTKVM